LENDPMKTLTLLRVLAVAVVPACVAVPTGGFAANADDPYGNVDRRNDLGNNTGDTRVDGLNEGQLNRNYRGPLELRAPATNPPMAAQSPSPAAPR
jgi:hypothetical protein